MFGVEKLVMIIFLFIFKFLVVCVIVGSVVVFG